MAKTYQPKLRSITRLGNPILRQKTRQLTKEEILSDEIQRLIADARYTLEKEKVGVGLAASQIGENVALSVIAFQPRPNQKNMKPFDTVIINPKVVRGIGAKRDRWEGCLSVGRGDDMFYGIVQRYPKIELSWYDAAANFHQEILSGFPAHIAQHETDHLNGIVFMDIVDVQTLMTGDEYQNRILRRPVQRDKK